jgi:polyribonucleotide nucleotidyltransferase
MHGGKSTGPRTPEGIEKIRASRFKHGEYTKQAQEEKQQIRSLIKSLGKTIEEIDESAGLSFSIKQ